MSLFRFIGLYVCLLLVASLTAACFSPAPTREPATTPAPGSSSPVAPSLPSSDNWPTYHRDLSRNGYDPRASFGASLHRLWSSDRLDGDIYAEPLTVGENVLVATEQNSVYSLDIRNGDVLWRVNLGAPVPLSELSCGNIDPSGITGTPVADPAAGRLYVVARLQPDHHDLFALDIATGSIIWHRTVDPPGADPRVQQQRAALALANDKVYIAFGGLYGDCGSYYGWLIGAPTGGNGQLVSFRVSSHRGAALWAPSGPAVDSTGNLYVTSGNGFSGSTFDYGNSVLRLSPSLSLMDWFAPANWQELDDGDIDLGSIGPVLLQPDLLFQAGKEGKGYLLRASSLGHIGGEIFSRTIGQGAYGGAAYAPPYIFVPCTNGLVALHVNSGPSFTEAWSGPHFFAGPPAAAPGTVWTVDIGSGTLYGLTVDKGEVIAKISLGPVTHFTTPAISGGSILVAADRQIVRLVP